VRIAFFLVFFLALALAGCATPRIVVLSDPLDAREHNDLGASYETSGELDLALKAYETAAAKDRSWDQPLINLGNVHSALGDWTQAAASYRQALKRNPENSEAMNNLAYALVNLDESREALEWSSKAVQAEPANPLFRATLAQALAGTGEREKALALLDETLQTLSSGDPLHGEMSALRDRIASESF
jgi:tetratricopeptide (TPR) repeat protein